MCRAGIALVVLAVLGSAASAQTINDAAKGMLGSWEFSNAEHDRKCTVTFRADRIGSGYRVDFDPKCGDQFPFVKDVVSWNYPDNDLLRLIDSQGKALAEFSEVETGMFEAPTPGFGVLFLQNAADAAPQTVPLDPATGDWALVRGTGKPLCVISFVASPADQGFSLTVKPGCDPSIVRLNFSHWILDGDELTISPEHGNPWRFEQDATNTWLRVPASINPYTLVRQ